MNIISRFFRSLCLGLVFATTHAHSADSISQQFISQALQGDLSQAGYLFTSGPDSGSMSVTELSKQFHSRFVEQSDSQSPGTGDVLADAIISAYRKYWILTLMRQLSFEDGEDFLAAALVQVLSSSGNTEIPVHAANVFERVGEALKEKDFQYLDTPAPPLRDLFLWKTEENRIYTVRLTDLTQTVRVTFMSDLYSMGWKQYATLGLVSTTGWVEGGRLYCVAWAYDRNSENFEVSYLKHESRHLADLERFPALQSADLEYRAKLTELVFASNSLKRLLDDFTNKSALNPASPHSYANYRVTRDVYREMFAEPFPESADPWQEVSAQLVSTTARDLLRANTEMLQTASP